MLQKLINVSVNSLKRRNLPVIVGKVAVRFKEFPQKKRGKAVLQWCATHAESYEQYARALDPALWRETEAVCRQMCQAGTAKLAKLDFNLGGGGNYPLLYFFTRYLNAEIVVETGVAAGWSSQAILLALKENNNGGKLYSSDFPYFRCQEPEKLIGHIVDDNLKPNWHLFIDGDQHNLPKIVSLVEKVDLFHYDSDKSYKGRENALYLLDSVLSDSSIVLLDDIQDNFQFRDFVKKNSLNFKVFEFEGKYVGLMGSFP